MPLKKEYLNKQNAKVIDMKKIIAIVLVLLAVLSVISGCSPSPADKEQGDKQADAEPVQGKDKEAGNLQPPALPAD